MADSDVPKDDTELLRKLHQLIDKKECIADLGAIFDQLLSHLNDQLANFRKEVKNFDDIVVKFDALDQSILEHLSGVYKTIAAHLSEFKANDILIEEIRSDLHELLQLHDKNTSYFSNWRWIKLIIARLEIAFEQSADNVKTAFTSFEQDYQILLDFKNRLENINTYGYDDQLAEIYHQLLTAPDISVIPSQFYRLEQKMIENREARQMYQKKLQQYRWSGFLTTRLENILQEDLSTVKREFELFEKDYHKMKALRDRLVKLDVRGFQTDLESIYHKMTDLSKVEEVARELNALESKIYQRK